MGDNPVEVRILSPAFLFSDRLDAWRLFFLGYAGLAYSIEWSPSFCFIGNLIPVWDFGSIKDKLQAIDFRDCELPRCWFFANPHFRERHPVKSSFFIPNFATVCTVLLTTFALSCSAIGQDSQFDGGASNPGDWNDATNWTNDTLPPDNTVEVLTEVGSSFGGLLEAEANIMGSLTTDNLWELRVARGNGSTGVVNHSAGTLNSTNWSFIGVDADDPMQPSSGTYNLTGTAVLNGGTNWFIGLGGGAGANQGFMTIADSAQATFGALVVGANDGNSGSVTQTGGSVEYNSWMTIGESSGATGVYNIFGGSLTQNADLLTIGQQDGANGSLNVSGTATIALNATGLSLGRVAGGAGRLEVDGSAASINTTNLFAGIDDGFGMNLGAPTGNATIAFHADVAGVVSIIASGDVWLNDGVINGAADLELDLADAPAGDLLLIEVGGALNGTFNGLAEGADVGFGRTITYEFGDGNDIGLLAAGGECLFALGDVNMDGNVDLLDVAPFVAILSGGGEYSCEADVNQDGSNDLLDVKPFVALLAG